MLCKTCNKICSTKFNIYCSNKCQAIERQIKIKQIIESNALHSWKAIRRYLISTVGNCQDCGISSWNNKPIVLECDHIDGDRTNNRLSNARLLCPNCHSQTDTYRAKNKNNPLGKEERSKRYKV